MLLILDCSIYVKLIKDLLNYYLMGADQYQLTRSKMLNTIVHWQNCTDRYGLCAPPGAIVFTQDNDNDSANGETHANDGQRETEDLRRVKCFR